MKDERTKDECGEWESEKLMYKWILGHNERYMTLDIKLWSSFFGNEKLWVKWWLMLCYSLHYLPYVQCLQFKLDLWILESVSDVCCCLVLGNCRVRSYAQVCMDKGRNFQLTKQLLSINQFLWVCFNLAIYILPLKNLTWAISMAFEQIHYRCTLIWLANVWAICDHMEAFLIACMKGICP